MLVFLADDQPDIRSALHLLLGQEPWLQIVGEAENAQQLLEQMQQLHPDVILLDWELPGLSHRILATLVASCPEASIVAMSGRVEARKNSLAAGAKAFVSKGEPPERLLAVLTALAAESAIS